MSLIRLPEVGRLRKSETLQKCCLSARHQSWRSASGSNREGWRGASPHKAKISTPQRPKKPRIATDTRSCFGHRQEHRHLGIIMPWRDRKLLWSAPPSDSEALGRERGSQSTTAPAGPPKDAALAATRPGWICPEASEVISFCLSFRRA